MDKLIKKLKLNDEFTKPPKRQKVFNKVRVPPVANYNFQADLLYLPETKKGYKYLLVVVDLATNKFDIEPMKTREAKTTLEAFKKMFKRKFIKMPYISIRTDNGGEFQKEFSDFLSKNKIFHSISVPYRHKQLANVESLNRTLGKVFNLYMNTMEIEDGEEFKEWDEIIEPVREILNKEREIKLPKYKDWNLKTFDVANYLAPMYKIGDIVHHKLEIPKNALNNNQNTKQFRVGDIRWNTTPKKIINVIYMPDKPFNRYILEGMPNVSYSKYELMRAKPEEKETKYDVEKLLKVRSVKGKKQYLVKWIGYTLKDATFEDEARLIEDLGKEHFNKLVNLMK